MGKCFLFYFIYFLHNSQRQHYKQLSVNRTEHMHLTPVMSENLEVGDDKIECLGEEKFRYGLQGPLMSHIWIFFV